jgi:hypothetical protein
MAALLLAALPALAQAPQQKPSIMLIVADDLGYGDTGPYDGGEGRPVLYEHQLHEGASAEPAAAGLHRQIDVQE